MNGELTIKSKTDVEDSGTTVTIEVKTHDPEHFDEGSNVHCSRRRQKEDKHTTKVFGQDLQIDDARANQVEGLKLIQDRVITT